ncbi:sugar transferase [Sediminibacterium ginsengisoli]|uniref:Sugar transferase involved in LPS biosynthesis (Colanic, teichoic acid) n=1 Tax=Sediminibacterium ginsengisoli TaxID=413434 RepID=A0A1T4N4T2_9BACT|nr:sugar transferase [Sediminibacterium ginsengisoli]SJZ74111.1 Sugar transferase involved in LPS biosynthesis (colanic, teichoic acid) [Sediminibacterium ginsengisoli]
MLRLKHTVDFIMSFVILLLTLPVSITAILVLWINNGGTPFFVQDRPGRHGKIFKLIKLKTMSDKKDANGGLLPDAERLTFIGALIRKTSVDEIPQLINVIKGDMSLVGPRPLLMEYLKLYTPFQARRHEMKPGITGWAQVNGRNEISWDKKFELDVWYIDNWTLFLDFKIMVLTAIKIVRAKNINTPGQATVERFKGNE